MSATGVVGSSRTTLAYRHIEGKERLQQTVKSGTKCWRVGWRKLDAGCRKKMHDGARQQRELELPQVLQDCTCVQVSDNRSRGLKQFHLVSQAVLLSSVPCPPCTIPRRLFLRSTTNPRATFHMMSLSRHFFHHLQLHLPLLPLLQRISLVKDACQVGGRTSSRPASPEPSSSKPSPSLHLLLQLNRLMPHHLPNVGVCIFICRLGSRGPRSSRPSEDIGSNHP